jgi:hypothetical protein
MRGGGGAAHRFLDGQEDLLLLEAVAAGIPREVALEREDRLAQTRLRVLELRELLGPLGDRPTLKGKDNGRRRRNGLLGRHPVQRAVQCRRHAVRAPSGVCVSDQRLGILS